MSPQTIAVFPDTNLFWHYRPINEIDWCTLVQGRSVEIKIAAAVTRELEEQKVVHQSRRIRDRAASAVKLLHTYIRQGQVREGVTLQFLINEPAAEFAAACGLNLLLGDDQLIGALLLHREANSDTCSDHCGLPRRQVPILRQA